MVVLALGTACSPVQQDEDASPDARDGSRDGDTRVIVDRGPPPDIGPCTDTDRDGLSDLVEGAPSVDTDSDGMVSASELRDLVDARLQLICPVCDAVLDPGASACPECGSVLKGDNQVPRPEQGYFLDADIDLWTVPVD